MHSSLVLIHVVSMIVSLGFMTSAIVFGLFGKRFAAQLSSISFFATISGFATGGILLFDAVLSVECALLTAYLVGVAVVYHYGFAFGDASKARLIRES